MDKWKTAKRTYLGSSGDEKQHYYFAENLDKFRKPHKIITLLRSRSCLGVFCPGAPPRVYWACLQRSLTSGSAFLFSCSTPKGVVNKKFYKIIPPSNINCWRKNLFYSFQNEFLVDLKSQGRNKDVCAKLNLTESTFKALWQVTNE
jgi:hypothetical protein